MDLSMAIQNIPLKESNFNRYANGNIEKLETKKEAFQSFEALFISSILTDMTKAASIDLSGEKRSMEKDWIWSLMAQTVAEEIAKGEGMGLGKMMMEQIDRQ